MRIFTILALLAAGTLPTAAQPSAGSCSFEGRWQSEQGFVTTIDAQRQWRTFASASSSDPVGRGWVVHDEQTLTFDYEGAEHGYAYEWRFGDRCTALDLVLVEAGGRPTDRQFRIHFTRLE